MLQILWIMPFERILSCAAGGGCQAGAWCGSAIAVRPASTGFEQDSAHPAANVATGPAAQCLQRIPASLDADPIPRSTAGNTHARYTSATQLARSSSERKPLTSGTCIGLDYGIRLCSLRKPLILLRFELNTKDAVQSTGKLRVTRAKEIAALLSETARRHSHACGIDKKTLHDEAGLRIEDLSDESTLLYVNAFRIIEGLYALRTIILPCPRKGILLKWRSTRWRPARRNCSLIETKHSVRIRVSMLR